MFDAAHWRQVARDRFGPVPEGDGENARLIAGYHYAFIEGAKAAFATLQKASHGSEDKAPASG